MRKYELFMHILPSIFTPVVTWSVCCCFLAVSGARQCLWPISFFYILKPVMQKQSAFVAQQTKKLLRKVQRRRPRRRPVNRNFNVTHVHRGVHMEGPLISELLAQLGHCELSVIHVQ